MALTTLKGQTVVVIGGTSGIGLAVAKLSLLDQAAHVVIASSNQTKVDDSITSLEALASSAGFGGKVLGKAVDVTDLKAVETFITELGEIDHLVYTSGEHLKLGFPNVDLEEMRSAFDVRYWGAVAAVKAAKFKKGGSVTLTIGSVIRRPQKSWSIIAGIAGAVDSLVRGLAVDYAPIRVNVISPGIVKTPLWDPMSEEQRTKIYESAAEKLLLKHVAEAEEVAEAYLFTMKCQYITGQRIEVDGGGSLV